MKTFLDCVPCFVRQALDATRLVTDDVAIQEQVLREVLRSAATIDLRSSPVEMAQQIHRRIREITGQEDPYRAVKDRFNDLALRLLPSLGKKVEESFQPLETAVRLAIAGNIIDFGVRADIDDAHIHESIEHALSAPLQGEMQPFAEAVGAANDILYLADNTGEIVFDQLLIRQLPMEKVTVAVKGAPIINDATMIDAETTGLTKLVEVIDNGDDAPGTILENCSENFQERFAKADLILAKGQGNYESVNAPAKTVFFILKAKCPVLARDVGCGVGDLVLKMKGEKK